MKIENQVDQVISTLLLAIIKGEQTLESVLQKHPQIAAELKPRLEAALWLQVVKKSVEPRPGFISSSRKYLETQITSHQVVSIRNSRINHFSPQRWAFNIASPLVVLLLLVLVINSVVLTARLSIPGDPLYSTKLLFEDIHLALTNDQVEKTDLYINYSRERTTEFVELVLEGDYRYLPAAAVRLESEIISSLHALNKIPSNDSDNERRMINNLRETLSNEKMMLDLLKTTSPPFAYPGIELAINATQSGLLALH